MWDKLKDFLYYLPEDHPYFPTALALLALIAAIAMPLVRTALA